MTPFAAIFLMPMGALVYAGIKEVFCATKGVDRLRGACVALIPISVVTLRLMEIRA